MRVASMVDASNAVQTARVIERDNVEDMPRDSFILKWLRFVSNYFFVHFTPPSFF